MERKHWMIPRAKRQVPVWKIIQFLNIFNSASDNPDWELEVKKLLEQKNLKRDFGSYDKNPGGNRTYRSQLECLGFLYRDDDKNIQLTKAGRDLVRGHDEPLLILQKMILRNQYPSVYSLGRNVKISPKVKVKPFLFLLDLINDIGRISREETAVAVIYGSNHDQAIDIVKTKIFQLRGGYTFNQILDDDNDIWSIKTKDNPIEQRIEEVHNIANTFHNYLESARLVERSKSKEGDYCYLNAQGLKMLTESNYELIEESDSYIKENPISFQRRFGAWDGKKDTMRISEKAEPVKDPEELMIKNEFIEFLSEGLRDEAELDQFRERMRKHGFAKKKVNSIISKLNSQNTSLFEDRFQFISKAGAKHASEFEKALVRLLNLIGLEAYHTGDLKRPKGSGGYADAYAIDEESGFLFDTKASEYYSVSHEDLSKACQTYIPNWYELFEEHGLPKSNELVLFCYLAGGYKKGADVEGRLNEIKDKTNVQSSALTAWDFFKYVQKNEDCSVDDFLNKVLEGGIITLN